MAKSTAEDTHRCIHPEGYLTLAGGLTWGASDVIDSLEKGRSRLENARRYASNWLVKAVLEETIDRLEREAGRVRILSTLIHYDDGMGG